MTSKENHPALSFLRASIDNIDSAILSLLFHRANIVNYVKQYKTLHGIDLSRSKLREEALKELVDFASGLQLRGAFVRNIFEQLYQESDQLYSDDIPESVKTFLFQDKNLLEEFNQSLKNIDMSFCTLLLERMHLVKKVGEYKKQHDLPILAQSRWEAVLKTKMDTATSLGINPEVIRKLYTTIHEEALAIEGRG